MDEKVMGPYIWWVLRSKMKDFELLKNMGEWKL